MARTAAPKKGAAVFLADIFTINLPAAWRRSLTPLFGICRADRHPHDVAGNGRRL